MYRGVQAVTAACPAFCLPEAACGTQAVLSSEGVRAHADRELGLPHNPCQRCQWTGACSAE